MVAHQRNIVGVIRAGLSYGYKLGFAFLLISVVFNAARVGASSLSEGYKSESNYKAGTIVALSSVTPPTVTLATIVNNSYLVGVVEPQTDSLLAIETENQDVNVALEGDVITFVSDVNGDIFAGDFIGTSWIAGVGMKAIEGDEQRLLGIALEDFDSTADGVGRVTGVQTPDGNKDVRVGSIAVRLFDRDVGPDVSANESILESIASRIAGKNVPIARALLAVGLFAITSIIAGVFLANAIRGSFISLGRNPLAGRSIFASLMQVSGVSISLLLIGSLISYVVLVI